MDAADQAQETQERVTEIALRRNNENQYACFAIGEYRNCKDCGEPIPVRRLGAAPGTVRCVRCQTDYESR